MKTSENGIELIKKFEGFCATPYFCPAGKLTVGYGHVVISGEKFPARGISEDEAEKLLRKDVSIAEKSINNLVKINLSQNQFDALVSFVFNIGTKAFANSKLIRLLNENKLELAKNEFSRWIYTNGKTQNGLINRRKAEQKTFETG